MFLSFGGKRLNCEFPTVASLFITIAVFACFCDNFYPFKARKTSKGVIILSSSLDARKRNFVVRMIKHAWRGYLKYAWSANQLHPISKTPDDMQPYLSGNLGATIVDSLDTLFLAGLDDDFRIAKLWVRFSLNFSGPFDVSVFETNIRFVGGLLSAYALTHEEDFLLKAKEIVLKLQPAFETPTELPRRFLNLQNMEATGGCTSLAEMGTLSMEFLYLSHISGHRLFQDKISKITRVLASLKKPNGLYYNSINPDNGNWCSKHVSVGALGDSFYEYLFKTWLLTSRTDADSKKTYDVAIDAVFQHLLQKSTKGHFYFAESHDGKLVHKMGHLACFMGGLLALSAKYSKDRRKYMEVADAIGETCHASYASSPNKIGPDEMKFNANESASSKYDLNNAFFLQRPEVVETYFYLWRLTHNAKWRQYGWEAAEAIERHTRVESGGYSGIKNVYEVPVVLDDVQQSFFLAETLKYLLLLFSPDDVLPLNKFVFNTEAHPLPIFKPRE